jgi:hypothetical protein
MKKHFTFLTSLTLAAATCLHAQVFTPISSTGYTLDAIAENTTALATTSGPIDGSNYVLYSQAYGALMASSAGLPNNGLLTTGTRTYQLQSYTAGNVGFAMAGQSFSISLTTPAPFAGISVLGFGTEGSATFNMVMTFTDNSTFTFTNQTFADWFNSGNTVTSGFDRCNRTNGTPANASGNPKMFYLDFPLNCAERSKALTSITFFNTGANARLCVLGISGTGAPSYSATAGPVTCLNGINGTATVSADGGLPPFTYTWSTSPAQTTSILNNVPTGVYSYSVQDNGGCVVSNTIAITQSLAPQPNLGISSSATTVCSGGTFTLGVGGATTYTWDNGSNSFIYAPPAISVSTQTTVTYTVSGITSDNCLRTGSISIVVNPLPAAAFSSSIPAQCKTNPPLQLSPFSQPTGGVFAGIGVTSGSFIPNNVAVGAYTIMYTRTDANNCSNTATMAVTVSSLAAPAMSLAGPFCSNASAQQLSVTLPGGGFNGNGVSSTGLFSPSVSGAGSHPVTYSITNGPCTTSAGITILVNAAPTASIVNPKTFFCRNQSAVFLNGSPAGGSFSGNGITGSAFNPATASISNTNIIIYTYTDLNGCTDTASVRITVSTCAGIAERSAAQKGFVCYPNPSKGTFVMDAQEDLRLEITSLTGQKIDVLQIEKGSTSLHLSLPAGVYLLSTEDRQITERLIITE